MYKCRGGKRGVAQTPRTCSRLVAMAISPQVMSTPRPLQMRRNGRFPTVVKGAR